MEFLQLASNFESHPRFVKEGKRHSWCYPVGCLYGVQLNKQSRQWCRMWSWLPVMALLNCTSMDSFSISGRGENALHRKPVWYDNYYDICVNMVDFEILRDQK